MNHDAPSLESDYAMTIDVPGRLEQRFVWTGWKTHHWPAVVIKPGLLLYGFDKKDRKLRMLLRVTKGGCFFFRSLDEFVEEVERLTGKKPDRTQDTDKWAEIEERVEDAKSCTGICLCFEFVKSVSIPLSGKCPRLGWIQLRNPNFGME
jgi:hypothetical protein